jgi:hypothetical protein
MAEKRLKLKTTKMGGKGGSIFSSQPKSGLFYFITLILIFSLSFQPVAFAYRSSAGGGKLAKFDTGKWLVGTGIGLASMTVGSGIVGAIGGQDFSSALSAQGFATNYSIMTATNQVGRAVGAMGRYYGWDPKSTVFISSLATSMASGGINPSQFGKSVSGIGNGIVLGAINGAAEGAVLSSLADKNGHTPLWAGPVAGLAGNFASGVVVGGLSFGIDSVKYTIPHSAVSLGVNALTKNMQEQDAYIVRQAFSGVSPIVNALTNGKHVFINPSFAPYSSPQVNQVNIPSSSIGGPGGVSMKMEITEENFIKNSSLDKILGPVLKSRPDSNDLSWTVGEPNSDK